VIALTGINDGHIPIGMGITVGVDKLATLHFFFPLMFILLLLPLVSGTRTVGRVNFISTGIFIVLKHNNLKDVRVQLHGAPR